MNFAYNHPMPCGVAVGAALASFLFLYANRSEADGASPKPREKYLPRLHAVGAGLLIFAFFPLLGTMHRSTTVNDHQRHFGYVALLISLGMIGLSLVLLCAWWVLAGIMFEREQSRTGRE